MKPNRTGPVAGNIPVPVQAGPRRGSASSGEGRANLIEQCARIAESYANRRALSTRAMAKDIAAEIRALAGPDAPSVKACDRIGIPRWGFA